MDKENNSMFNSGLFVVLGDIYWPGGVSSSYH